MNPLLEFYATPGRHTDVTSSGLEIASVDEAVEIVQGLLLYDTVAKDFYDTDLAPAQAAGFLLRDAQAMLDLATSVDGRPLTESRAFDRRVGARCNTFSLLTVALLRASGIPARSRCGFGAYFVPGWFEDHWVVEYWDSSSETWVMVDAQLDPLWRQMLGIEREAPVVVDATEFVTAGHAWQAWRRGELDANRCGLTMIPEHGSFWIAGNLRLDFAALNKVEMSPWDLWGLFWEPEDESQPTEATLETFDQIAELTTDPDSHFDEIRARYEADDQLRMDGTVFSVAAGEVQTV